MTSSGSRNDVCVGVCAGVFTLQPQAASAGANTRLTLSPTPPVECLSTTSPAHSFGHDSTSPDDIISLVRVTISVLIIPFCQIAISMAPEHRTGLETGSDVSRASTCLSDVSRVSCLYLSDSPGWFSESRPGWRFWRLHQWARLRLSSSWSVLGSTASPSVCRSDSRQRHTPISWNENMWGENIDRVSNSSVSCCILTSSSTQTLLQHFPASRVRTCTCFLFHHLCNTHREWRSPSDVLWVLYVVWSSCWWKSNVSCFCCFTAKAFK